MKGRGGEGVRERERERGEGGREGGRERVSEIDRERQNDSNNTRYAT